MAIIRTTRKELRRIIAEERQLMTYEANQGQIDQLKGQEVSMRYRKANGETKTYFGRIVNSDKAPRGTFFMGVMERPGQKGGLKLFKVDGVMAVSKASLSEIISKELDEMCKDETIAKYEGKIREWVKLRETKLHETGQELYRKYGLSKFKNNPGKYHQLKIAIDTLNMPPTMAGVMGGPTPDEAKRVIKQLTGKDAVDEANWIQKAVNPAHKGYCTPMTKATCTPRRKALAKRFKKGIEEVSPPGWSGTVKAMGKHPEITNRYALANWMEKQGAKPHYKPMKEKKTVRKEGCKGTPVLKPQYKGKQEDEE